MESGGAQDIPLHMGLCEPEWVWQNLHVISERRRDPEYGPGRHKTSVLRQILSKILILMNNSPHPRCTAVVTCWFASIPPLANELNTSIDTIRKRIHT